MFKICGIIMVLSSSTLLGIYFAMKDSFRLGDLCQLRKALYILKSEIGYALTPLPVAMANIAGKIESPASEIFQAFYEISPGGKDGAGELWQNALEKNKNRLYLEEEDYEALTAFGKTLGYLDLPMQLNNIDLTITYLDDKIGALRQSSIKSKKLYTSLGLLGGLFICVILI